mmetsp:Transcript_21404/g.51057  ORF Transcript_21404/g.51057 Transcript_21404/m.51057 type:complete len:205 (-) Transcript_21404:2126-2740(-)
MVPKDLREIAAGKAIIARRIELFLERAHLRICQSKDRPGAIADEGSRQVGGAQSLHELCKAVADQRIDHSLVWGKEHRVHNVDHAVAGLHARHLDTCASDADGAVAGDGDRQARAPNGFDLTSVFEVCDPGLSSSHVMQEDAHKVIPGEKYVGIRAERSQKCNKCGVCRGKHSERAVASDIGTESVPAFSKKSGFHQEHKAVAG